MNHIDISLIFAQLFNFLILFFLFKYFLAEPLHTMITKRKMQLQKLDLAELQYQEKMTLAESQKQDIISQAQQTSRSLMQESEHIAQAKADILIAEAQARVTAILESGRREIEKERRSMLAQMKSHILDVSLRLNQKMFGTAQENKEFIENEFEKMK